MTQEFKRGDVVELKSGSPRFTVTVPKNENGFVEVVMWDENCVNGMRKFSFRPDLLSEHLA